MSPKRDKTVPQLVEKYRNNYPNLDRDLLRKLIRLENKIENPSELKKLDRYLRKAFAAKYENQENSLKDSETNVSIDKIRYEYMLNNFNEIRSLFAYGKYSMSWNLLYTLMGMHPLLKAKVMDTLKKSSLNSNGELNQMAPSELDLYVRNYCLNIGVDEYGHLIDSVGESLFKISVKEQTA